MLRFPYPSTFAAIYRIDQWTSSCSVLYNRRCCLWAIYKCYDALSSVNIGLIQGSHNNIRSSMPKVMKRNFFDLKRRWLCLLCLSSEIKFATKLIAACRCLHNIFIDLEISRQHTGTVEMMSLVRLIYILIYLLRREAQILNT